MLIELKDKIKYFADMFTRCNKNTDKLKKSGMIVLLFLLTLSSHAQMLSSRAKKVQKLMPKNTVIAHRGTIYWAPELTEAAFRWGRNSGADYLELDVHRTKDGQLVVTHDKTLKRTTDVAQKFPGRENEPIGNFTLEEILQLDAGSTFNKNNPDQARQSFAALKVLVFEDVFRIAEGKKIKRNADGSRKVHKNADGKYIFEYEQDPADNGNRPGIYIETKSPESYPELEQQIYQELSAFGWNPLEENTSKYKNRFYKKGKVNVGNTKGEILIQTFSRKGMLRFRDVFKGEVPTSFLVKSADPDDPELESKIDEVIDFAISSGAQFIGTNISLYNGAVNKRLFIDKIEEAGLRINIYSFNTNEEMNAYFNPGCNKKADPPLDGMITNRTDLTTHFYNKHNSRPIEPSEDPRGILDELGY
jgi:glycerophosphoryl diester phosphodiesterase